MTIRHDEEPELQNYARKGQAAAARSNARRQNDAYWEQRRRDHVRQLAQEGIIDPSSTAAREYIKYGMQK